MKDKLHLLEEFPNVLSFCSSHKKLESFLASLPLLSRYAFYSILAIEQQEIFFSPQEKKLHDFSSVASLLKQLIEVEEFYSSIGGIIGYHITLLDLLYEKETKQEQLLKFYPPSFIEISAETISVKEHIIKGIEQLVHLAEMYPLGGAADRLHLLEKLTKEALPAAKLPFAGKTLLEHLMEDLQAKEYLYYKLFSRQISIPVIFMTSHEKNNYFHIQDICKKKRWFGKREKDFIFLIQPLAPTVDEEGKWCLSSPFSLLMKPGGHGVIWKLAKDQKVFERLKREKKKKILLRQINNPLAGTDYGIFAFLGYGWEKDSAFGFASCERPVHAAEGVNVLVESEDQEGFHHALSNIEYCDFEKYGIVDTPLKKNGNFSSFSSNTNILFADVLEVEKAVEKDPFPGMLVNMKEVVDGEQKKPTRKKVGRLEAIMQNIAGVFSTRSSQSYSDYPHLNLKSFITYNKRKKTISTIKKVLKEKPYLETPEMCFYELLENAEDLLQNSLLFSLPRKRTFEEYLQKGPSFLFLYHPCLGPFYSIISQKIQGGEIEEGGELQLFLSDVEIRSLFLKGSLLIRAKNKMGHVDEEGLLSFSAQSGKCRLKNVRVENQGVDWPASENPWKGKLVRKESCEIYLEGMSEFIAENVTIRGNGAYRVADGYRLTLKEESGELVELIEKISEPSWTWEYAIDEESSIILQKKIAKEELILSNQQPEFR